jgi:predicted RNA-binding Zn-ribbon protein involved in translation (DUF1610 family)
VVRSIARTPGEVRRKGSAQAKKLHPCFVNPARSSRPMPSATVARRQILKSQTQCPNCGARIQLRCLAYRHKCPELRGPRRKRTVRELTDEEVAVRAEQLSLKASGTFLRRIAARAPSTVGHADGEEPAPVEGES